MKKRSESKGVELEILNYKSLMENFIDWFDVQCFRSNRKENDQLKKI